MSVWCPFPSLSLIFRFSPAVAPRRCEGKREKSTRLGVRMGVPPWPFLASPSLFCSAPLPRALARAKVTAALWWSSQGRCFWRVFLMSVRATARRTDSRKYTGWFCFLFFSASQGWVSDVVRDHISESCQLYSSYRLWELKGGTLEPEICEFPRILIASGRSVRTSVRQRVLQASAPRQRVLPPPVTGAVDLPLSWRRGHETTSSWGVLKTWSSFSSLGGTRRLHSSRLVSHWLLLLLWAD